MTNINDFLTFYLSKRGNSNLQLGKRPLKIPLIPDHKNLTSLLAYFSKERKIHNLLE